MIGQPLTSLIALLGASLLTLQAVAQEKASVENETLVEVGKMFDATIKVIRIPITGKGRFLRINKNGKDTAAIPLDLYNHLTVYIFSGKGLGLYPRDPRGPEGVSVRIVASGSSQSQTTSVSYTIPEKSSESSTALQQGDLLYDRRDQGTEKSSMGNLKIWLDTKDK